MEAKTERRAATAQEKLADSAEALVGRNAVQESSADRRTRLAADRTRLASERTYAAWMRTGLAALAAGVGAQALLDGLVAEWLVLTASIALIVFSEFCFVAGIWRELTGNRLRPDPGAAALPARVLVLFNGFLVVLGAAVLVGIASR